MTPPATATGANGAPATAGAGAATEGPRPSVPSSVARPFWQLIEALAHLGSIAVFAVEAFVAVPVVLRRYRKEYLRLLGEVTFGTRILAIVASTVVVAGLLSAVVGVQLALEGAQALNIVGLGALSGYLSAFANTRELTPLLTAFGLAAQMGCRFTSELGAMRVTDEIDALEVMSVPSLTYLVTTRIMAALTVAVPLYLAALAGAYLATQVTVVAIGHQGSGTYLHYFHEFLTARDILLSVVKVIVFAILITIIHCYYGYNTQGGPEGVGKAAGRAIRASVVSIAVSDMLMTVLFWGTSSGVKVSG